MLMVLAAGLAMGLQATPAAAVPSWHAPVTVTPVRGIPEPMAAIDDTGRAIVVYSDARPADPPGSPVYATWRFPGGTFSAPARLGDGEHARVAVTPEGTTAIAWADGDRIQLLLQPAPGRPGAPGGYRRWADAGGAGVSDLKLAIDRTGRATAVWKHAVASDGGEQVQLRAVTLSPDGSVGPVQELGAPARCPGLSVDGNLAGDAVALCSPGSVIHIRPAGGDTFVSEPTDNGSDFLGYATVDGAGAVTVAIPIRLSSSFTTYRTRPRGGAFGPSKSFPDLASLYAQEDRTVAVWRNAQGVGYAIRPVGGDFGPARQAMLPSRVGGSFAEVTAPLGPLPVMTGFETFDDRAPLHLGAISVAPDGAASPVGQPTIPGRVDYPGNIAGNSRGLAIFAWEQRCGDGFAVMAMVLDERRGSTDPPCQDRVAPKVLIRPARARLVGRTLRFRAGCDESCRLVVRTRVLRGGKGRPLATKKTPRPQRLAAGRFRAFKLRLRADDASRVTAVLAAGRRVTVRFALSVRDDYENGTVRRVAVPLRR